MAEDIKSLIEKIQQEGIEAAEKKAQVIKDEASRQAELILAKAKKEADEIITQAKDKISLMENSAKITLQQAGRDFILILRKEVADLLNKIILSEIRKALTSEELAKIIFGLVKNYSPKEKREIIVSLSPEDLQKIEKGFLKELEDQLKQGITLRGSDEIRGGFLISYDAGKSQFDFSDAALTDYLGSYLKPKLAEILGAESIKK